MVGSVGGVGFARNSLVDWTLDRSRVLAGDDNWVVFSWNNGRYPYPKKAVRMIRSSISISAYNATTGRLEYTQEAPFPVEDMPEDTELYDILTFFGQAYRKYPHLLVLDGLISLFVGIVSAGLAFVFLDNATIGITFGLVAWGFMLTRLPARTTRHVYVKRLDDRGRAYIDDQAWWRSDYRLLPDSIQFVSENGKTPWLDTLKDPSAVHTFDPWEGSDPAADIQAADIIAQEALNQSGKTLALYQAKRSLLNKYGWQLMVLGIAFILLFMAANRTQEYFGLTPNSQDTEASSR